MLSDELWEEYIDGLTNCESPRELAKLQDALREDRHELSTEVLLGRIFLKLGKEDRTALEEIQQLRAALRAAQAEPGEAKRIILVYGNGVATVGDAPEDLDPENMTPEQADTVLRAEGLDPEKVSLQGEVVALKALNVQLQQAHLELRRLVGAWVRAQQDYCREGGASYLRASIEAGKALKEAMYADKSEVPQ